MKTCIWTNCNKPPKDSTTDYCAYHEAVMKQAEKGDSKMTEHNSEKKGLSPLDTLPKVAAQITINLHVGGKVTGTMPTDMKVMAYMLGEFIKNLGQNIIYQEASQIISLPPGSKLVKP